jgi:general secretion pathway protein B
MSYILDALKKVEEKREQEELPSKLTFSGELPPERKKRSLWPYFLFTALLLNVVVITFFVRSPRSDKGSTVVQEIVLQQPVPVTTTDDKNGVREILQDTKEIPQKKNTAQSSSRAIEKEVKETSLPVLAVTRAPEHALTERKPDKKKGGTSIDRLFSLGELPHTVKTALPEFRVSGHAYSPDRLTRVTRVNDKILQEGQELEPGLRVEEIIPEGIIFSYQRYRFLVGTNENR